MKSEVYRLRAFTINDKPIEVIVRQMMRWGRGRRGDTAFLLETQVDKFRFREENERAIANGGQAGNGSPMSWNTKAFAFDGLISSRRIGPGNGRAFY